MRPMSNTAQSATHKVCLSLGSNMGDRLANLRAANKALARYMTLTGVSPVYETSAAYVTDQPDFLNAAVSGHTALEPQALLFTIKQIERDIGRTPTFRYGPRIIDIDILFYDDLHMSSAELNVPHALLHERSFVLKPLADIAADWRHPVNGKTVKSMLEALPDHNDLRAINETL